MRIVAELFLLYGVWMMLWAAATSVPFFFGPPDLVAQFDEYVPAIVQWVLPAAMSIIGSFAMLAGVGLLRRADWGRPTATLTALVSLPFVPIGTAFGALALWTLARSAARELSAAPAPAASA